MSPRGSDHPGVRHPPPPRLLMYVRRQHSGSSSVRELLDTHMAVDARPQQLCCLPGISQLHPEQCGGQAQKPTLDDPRLLQLQQALSGLVVGVDQPPRRPTSEPTSLRRTPCFLWRYIPFHCPFYIISEKSQNLEKPLYFLLLSYYLIIYY